MLCDALSSLQGRFGHTICTGRATPGKKALETATGETRMKPHAIFAAASLLLASCATSPPQGAGAMPEQVCEEPRPQACTMDYRPVCARLEDGSQKTYSNACGACADGSVVAWREGACAE
jgi:hypothetical protein